ncbi:UNVERIFIED_CONTAM: hypothetical protein Sradi_6828600 [Sesamum radiatum]|uniref:Zinc finger PMZ-type domain-containing protein n=1 Tax=Sesamum radiatum TaxID=300843 RepID=A0AAW2JTH6_SESRA
MVLANYADFDVWVGGVIEWVPAVRLLNGDDGIIELLRAYKGLDVIPLYFEEKQGPLLVIDTQDDWSVDTLEDPENDQIEPENPSEPEIETENDQLEPEIATENDQQDLPITNELEYAYETHPELGQTSENPPGPSQTPENPHEPEQTDGNFPENPPIKGLSDEGGDDSDFGGSDSSASQCPSWMLEDLEGPLDDDIFESRPDDHARKLFKTMRVFLREQKKKRRAEREQREQEERTIRESGWFSDGGEEDELVSLRGSDDEGDGFPVWNDRMDGGDVDLQVGMKFATREKYRDVLRDWASQEVCPTVVKGNIKKQYERLYDYCATVEKHNPRSTLVLKVDRHMYNNFKGKFKGQELKKLFWKAASTYNVKQHLRWMKEIDRVMPKKFPEDETAYDWLCEIPVHHWARCFFPSRTKCDTLVNNISESFNSYILDAREQPIIDMFESIRRKCMTRIQVKREGMEKYQGVVYPNICKKIERQRHESRNCFSSWAGEDKFEVQHFLENHIVYLRDRHCSCGMFQLVGFPCHAIASISYHRLNMEEYVGDYFKKDAYLRVYGHMINPVPGMHDYEESPLGIVEPPQVKSKPGRPKKISQFSNDHAFQVSDQSSQARSDKMPQNMLQTESNNVEILPQRLVTSLSLPTPAARKINTTIQRPPLSRPSFTQTNEEWTKTPASSVLQRLRRPTQRDSRPAFLTQGVQIPQKEM